MGGNALAQQGIETRRVSAAEYHDQLVPAVMGKLRALFPGIEAEVIRSYRDKPDFGDMDVIANADTLPHDAVERVLAAFDPAAHYSNGPVLSFEYENFQIDLIRYRGAVYDFARHYFAYNDLGNLIGRTARRMDYIFGHDGLHFVMRDPDNEDRVIAKLTVTQDFEAALRFMGFDPDVHAAGFANTREIFEYAASTPYFDPHPFRLHNRSHRARVRDKKRPNYTAFLGWMRVNRPQRGALADIGPTEHLERAALAFPAFDAAMREAANEYWKDRAFRRRFNGERIALLTGLEGKALGAVMAAIAEQAGGTAALREAVLRFDHEDNVDDYLCHLLRQVQSGI